MFTASVEEALRKEERLLENAEMSLSSPIKVQRYVQEKRDCISQSQNKTTQIKTLVHREDDGTKVLEVTFKSCCIV